MTNKEITKFITENIKPLWPDWVLTEVELDVWIYRLRDYDSNMLSIGIKELYSSPSGQYKYPKLHQYLNILNKLFIDSKPSFDPKENEMVCYYTILCISHPTKKHLIGERRIFNTAWGKRKDIKDDETMLKSAQEFYEWVVNTYSHGEGEWIIEQTWQDYKKLEPAPF